MYKLTLCTICPIIGALSTNSVSHIYGLLKIWFYLKVAVRAGRALGIELKWPSLRLSLKLYERIRLEVELFLRTLVAGMSKFLFRYTMRCSGFLCQDKRKCENFWRLKYILHKFNSVTIFIALKLMKFRGWIKFYIDRLDPLVCFQM